MLRARWLVAATALVALISLAFLASDYRLALLRSLGVSGLAAATALALGLTYALLLVRWQVPGRRALLVLAVGPLVVPPYLAAIAWVDVFGPAGFAPRLLGLADPAGPSLLAKGLVYSTGSCGLLLGCSFFPLVALAAHAAVRRLPAEALDSARLVHGAAGERRVLAAAALPQAGAAALLVFALASVEFAVPQLLRVPVLAESVYLAMAADNHPAVALARSLPLVGIMLFALGAALLAWRRPPVGGGERVRPRALSPRGRLLGLAFCLLALGPGFLNPAASLAARLVVDPSGGPGGLSRAERILSAAYDVGAGDAGRSALVGASTATLCLALALLASWPLRRLRGAARLPLAWSLAALTSLPAPLVGIATITALDRDALAFLYDGLSAVVVACLIRFGPLAVLVCWLALHRVHPEQEEAARLVGRHPLGISLPQAAPSLVAAWLIVYVLSVTEFGASALVSPPGQSVLSVFLVNEAHYGQGAELSGLCVLLLAVVLLPWPVFATLGFVFRRRRST